MPRWIVFLLWSPAFLALTPAAQAEERIAAVLDTTYSGSRRDLYNRYYDRVRLLVHQAQLDVSSRLGLLQYKEGFQYPLTIRFSDDARPGTEYALAYVQFGLTSAGFAQELVVNLSVMEKNAADVDQVFRHEMTHAVLNDALGGEASRYIPPWVQEGLAQYAADEGDQRVAAIAKPVWRSQAERLLCDLNGAYLGRCYAQYYLAIQYLHDRHSSNSVQMFVRDLINGKSVDDSILDTLNVKPERFYQDVREYSLNVFRDKTVSGL